MARRIALLLWLFAGCSPPQVGSGNVRTEARSVGPFSELHVVGEFEIDVRLQSSEHRVELTTDDNLLGSVLTESNGKRLQVRLPRSSRPTVAKLSVEAPDLVLLRFEGDPKVEVESVRNARLQLDLTGAGKLHATGSTQKLKVFVDGNGQADLTELEISEALVHASGTATVDIAAPNHLEAELHGRSRVSYSGHPKVEALVRPPGVLAPRP